MSFLAPDNFLADVKSAKSTKHVGTRPLKHYAHSLHALASAPILSREALTLKA